MTAPSADQRRWSARRWIGGLSETRIWTYEDLVGLGIEEISSVGIIHSDDCVREHKFEYLFDICPCYPEEKIGVEGWIRNKTLMKKLDRDPWLMSFAFVKVYLRTGLTLEESDQVIRWCTIHLEEDIDQAGTIIDLLEYLFLQRLKITEEPPDLIIQNDPVSTIIDLCFRLILKTRKLEEAQAEIREHKKTLIIGSTPLYPDVAGVVMKELKGMEEA